MMLCSNCGVLYDARPVIGWDKSYCSPQCEQNHIKKKVAANRFWERKRHPTIKDEE